MPSSAAIIGGIGGMAYAGVYKQFGEKKRERALQELLSKADKNGNGRLFVSDFMEVMEANEVQVDDEEAIKIGELADGSGEIAKNDLVVFVKNSAMWKDNLEHMHKPGSRTSRVNVGIMLVLISCFNLNVLISLNLV